MLMVAVALFLFFQVLITIKYAVMKELVLPHAVVAFVSLG